MYAVVWCCRLMMSWQWNIYRVPGLYEGNPVVKGGFVSQRASYVDLKCFHCLKNGSTVTILSDVSVILRKTDITLQLIYIVCSAREVGNPLVSLLYPHRFNEVERGVYWFHLVRLSVCGQNRVRSVSSTILVGSISYLHMLISNSRRCVAFNACFKIQQFAILANSSNLELWLCLILTWDPIWLNSVGNHEAAGGILRTRAF